MEINYIQVAQNRFVNLVILVVDVVMMDHKTTNVHVAMKEIIFIMENVDNVQVKLIPIQILKLVRTVQTKKIVVHVMEEV